jgi:quinone-modifying oxidoreductase subunit QmoC
MASRIDPGIRHEIAALGAKDLCACMNCGFCTATCALSTETEVFPRRIIHLLQVGNRERLAGSLEPWLCYYCGDCSESCPRDADPGEIMMASRRYLAGVYDPTGITARILRSPAWHIGALCVGAGFALALILLYHVWYIGFPFGAFVVTPMGFEHMFPKLTYYMWAIVLVPLALILSRIPRIWRFVAASDGLGPVPLADRMAGAGTYLHHTSTQSRLRECPDQSRWQGHWLIAFGVTLMLGIKLFALHWFQTDAIYAVYHPQRWLGYLGFGCIVYGVVDNWARRRRDPHRESRFEDQVFPVLLLATAISGIAVHVMRYLGLPLTAHYFFAAHVVIATAMLLVELPFGAWTHAIYRPLALALAAVREKLRQSKADADAATVPMS